MLDKVQKFTAYLLVVIFATSALGYLFAPAAMLGIVGIASNAQSGFLVRTVAAALLAMALMAWAARNRDESRGQSAILLGLSCYMLLSSAVDIHAYVNDIVGMPAVLSIIVRILLGGILLYLAKK